MDDPDDASLFLNTVNERKKNASGDQINNPLSLLNMHRNNFYLILMRYIM